MAKPTIPEALPLLREWAARPQNSVGGIYHIVLGDSNPEQHSIDWCLEQAPPPQVHRPRRERVRRVHSDHGARLSS